MKALVEITRSDRTTFRQPLLRPKVSFGRSSRCDISLPDEPDLEPRHLFIIPDETGCRVELSSESRKPYSYQGQPLRNGLIPWGEDIFINKIRLCVVRESSKSDRTTIRERLILVALLLLCASAWMLFTQQPADDSDDSKEIAASSLFEQSIECSQPSLARYRAREVEQAAFAKMERYPFANQDGVEAVRLISEARACYQTAGETARAIRVEKALDNWKRRLEQDYRSLRLRLRLALSSAKNDEARGIARVLRGFLSHRDDDYTKWLDRVEHRLNAD